MLEVRQALRPLFRHRYSSALIILIIAFGIGVGCAFYSIGEGLLLRPLPFDSEGRLVDVDQLQRSGSRVMTSQQNLDDLRLQSKMLDGVAVYQMAWGTIKANGSAEYAQGMKVDRYFFPLLGVSPALGREFTTEDEWYGAPSSIIISYTYWKHRFSGDLTVLGKQILLDQRPYTVIGIMPELFYFPFLDVTEEDFWIPLQQSPVERRGNYDKHGIARIKAGATLKQAQAEASQIALRIREVYPQKEFSFGLRSYRKTVVEDFRPLLFILAGILVCIQLIVCINVATLLLVEAIRCRKEVEIRFALGGTRWKIARLFLLRALALALAGGITGTGLAYGLVLLTRRLLPAGFPGAHQITLDANLFWLVLIVSVTTGVFFGFWPATTATRKLHQVSLSQAGQPSAAGRSMQRSRRTLVTLQLAFSSAFLVITTLLAISFFHLLNVNLGMRLDHRLLISITPTDSTLKTEDTLRQFCLRIQEGLRSIPGVDAVIVSSDPPLTARGQTEFQIKDVPAPKDPMNWMATAETISPGYFHVLGIPVLRGRAFSDVDTLGGEPVAMVNEAFARQFFGTDSPLGKRICIGGSSCHWREIVGIVADARESRIDSPPAPTNYVPFWQAEGGFLSEGSFIVHTRISTSAITEATQKKMRALGAATVFGPFTLEEMRSRQLMGSRYRMWFLAAVAFLALALAAMGVYGVIAGDVEQRRREIGIRVALGASPRNVANLFQRQMLLMLIPGLLLGLGLAALLVRYTTSILYGIHPLDPAAYMAAAIVLGAVAFLATSLPVRDALRASPADVLRSE